jgi:NADPH:quinone reductase-like Zn-dependent oxidoreductase
MRAITFRQYGPPDVLKLEEVEKPAPRGNEVLIRIHAATVSAGDCELRRFDFPPEFWPLFRLMFGVRGPRNPIPGQDVAGVIEAVGQDVRNFKVGDQVFAATAFRFGSHAEYVCLPGNGAIAIKPDSLSLDEAVTLPTGGLNALHFIRRSNVQSGEKVLINGAGGSIGTIATQLAKQIGSEVTAVDSGDKLDMLRSLGADHVIDYTRDDFTRNGEQYDVILDVVGKSPFSRSVQSLRPNGRYLLGNLRLVPIVRGLWTSVRSDKKVIPSLAPLKVEDLNYLAGLMADDRLRTVIDRRYPLEQVAEAHRYIESGAKQGNVVVTVRE